MKPSAKMTTAFVTLVCSGLLSLNGCATAPARPPVQGSPTALAGSQWKLPVAQGSRDGRKVEFRQRGRDGFDVVLIDVGYQLDKVVGAYEGLVLMELKRDAGNATDLAGIARIPGRDLSEVRCSISDSGDEMKCNTEDFIWVRQS